MSNGPAGVHVPEMQCVLDVEVVVGRAIGVVKHVQGLRSSSRDQVLSTVRECDGCHLALVRHLEDVVCFVRAPQPGPVIADAASGAQFSWSEGKARDPGLVKGRVLDYLARARVENRGFASPSRAVVIR